MAPLAPPLDPLLLSVLGNINYHAMFYHTILFYDLFIQELKNLRIDTEDLFLNFFITSCSIYQILLDPNFVSLASTCSR